MDPSRVMLMWKHRDFLSDASVSDHNDKRPTSVTQPWMSIQKFAPRPSLKAKLGSAIFLCENGAFWTLFLLPFPVPTCLEPPRKKKVQRKTNRKNRPVEMPKDISKSLMARQRPPLQPVFCWSIVFWKVMYNQKVQKIPQINGLLILTCLDRYACRKLISADAMLAERWVQSHRLPFALLCNLGPDGPSTLRISDWKFESKGCKGWVGTCIIAGVFLGPQNDARLLRGFRF